MHEVTMWTAWGLAGILFSVLSARLCRPETGK